jgi:hypothetical protein
MRCPYCGKYLHISNAVKGRLRKEPVRITHTCGNDVVISPDDLEEMMKKRLDKIRPIRGIK